MNTDTKTERPTPISDAAYESFEDTSSERLRHFVDYAVSCDLERQLAERTEQRDRMARWIADHPPRFGGDHACAECHPYSDIVIHGFQCGYHTALATLNESGQ